MKKAHIVLLIAVAGIALYFCFRHKDEPEELAPETKPFIA